MQYEFIPDLPECGGPAIYNLRGRQVHALEVGGLHDDDYPEFPNAYFVSARFADTGEFLSEAELEKFEELHPGLASDWARS